MLTPLSAGHKLPGLCGFAVALVLLLDPAGLKAQQPAEPELMTLEQVLSLALKDNREIRNAQLEIQKSDNDISISRTYRYPSFDINFFEGQFLVPLKFEVPAGT